MILNLKKIVLSFIICTCAISFSVNSVWAAPNKKRNITENIKAPEKTEEKKEIAFEEEKMNPKKEEIKEAPLPIQYTWGDFLLGKNCSEDLTTLKKKDFLSPKEKEATDLMSKYCAKGKILAWQDLLITFRQNKQALLINQDKKEKSFINKYLKLFLHSSVDVHKTHPAGNTIEAQLDKAENTLYDKDIEKFVSIIQEFSADQKVFMTSVLNEAEQLKKLQQILTNH